MIYGVEERIDRLVEDENWTGYLFLSSTSTSGHVATATITNHFKFLAEHAGVDADVETPVPKIGHRFWYDVYR